ncbi:MAG: hypothetical protein ACRD5L_12440, partial [Bryobacteraceae bacterium]
MFTRIHLRSVLLSAVLGITALCIPSRTVAQTPPVTFPPDSGRGNVQAQTPDGQQGQAAPPATPRQTPY